jgi:hypothetical protein
MGGYGWTGVPVPDPAQVQRQGACGRPITRPWRWIAGQAHANGDGRAITLHQADLPAAACRGRQRPLRSRSAVPSEPGQAKYPPYLHVWWPSDLSGARRADLDVAIRPVLAIAVLLTGLLIALSNRYGYHRDELYFIECGKHLAWGYPDQPSLVPVVATLMTSLAPESLVALRLPSALAGGVLVVLTGLLTRELGGRCCPDAGLCRHCGERLSRRWTHRGQRSGGPPELRSAAGNSKLSSTPQVPCFQTRISAQQHQVAVRCRPLLQYRLIAYYAGSKRLHV